MPTGRLGSADACPQVHPPSTDAAPTGSTGPVTCDPRGSCRLPAGLSQFGLGLSGGLSEGSRPADPPLSPPPLWSSPSDREGVKLI